MTPPGGRVKSRTRPAPGNHDYETQQAAPYYAYFGENAGPSGLGYYSYHAGAWLVLSLNSNIPAGADSPQAAWVRATLAASPAACTLAYWHHPRFSSGPNGDNAVMRDIWTILQQGGAEVVVTGTIISTSASRRRTRLVDPIRSAACGSSSWEREARTSIARKPSGRTAR
jgi:3',5'-cyclic AMP phosphodiesterase CpdA